MFHNENMELSKERKKEIKMKLIEIIIDSLENGRLSVSELSNVSSFILDRIDKVADQNQLRFFLSELSSQWPIFTDFLVTEIGVVQEVKEDKAAEDMTALMQNGKMEEAVDLAKTVTDNPTK